MDTSGKDVVDGYIKGEDVPTIVGVAAIQTPKGLVHFANAVVDYSDMATEEARKGYTKTIEELWAENYFVKGLDLHRTAPETLRVSSRRQMLMMAIDQETNVLKAPSFFVDLAGEKDHIDRFMKLVEETGTWVLHIKTTLHSYLWVVTHPEGMISSSNRRDPFLPEQRNPKDL